MKKLRFISAMLISLGLLGCGGGSGPSVAIIADDTTSSDSDSGESIQAPGIEDRGWTASKRVELRILQSRGWVSDCVDFKKTKLKFSSEFLQTKTIVYKERSCETPREEIEYDLLERYSIAEAVTLPSGAVATRINLTTVQTLRQELYYLEGQQLYLGYRSDKASYIASDVNFYQAYQPDFYSY